MLTFEAQANTLGSLQHLRNVSRHAEVDLGGFLLAIAFVDRCGVSFDRFLVHFGVDTFVEAITKFNRLSQWAVRTGHVRLGDGDGECALPCKKDPKKNRGVHCLRS
jgi:hypothetical protein